MEARREIEEPVEGTRPFFVRVSAKPATLSQGIHEIIRVAEQNSSLIVHTRALNLGDEGVEIVIYLLSDQPRKLEEELAKTPAVKSVKIEDADGDPLLATMARGVEVIPLTPKILADMYESAGKIVGSVGAVVMSYHLAYRLGKQLMELVSSIRKPASIKDAVTYTKKIFEKTGLGELEVELVSREPLEFQAAMKPKREQLTEITAGMLRGIVAGSLAQALDTPLAVEQSKPAANGKIEFRITQTRKALL